MSAEPRPRTLDVSALAPLEAWLAERLGADRVRLSEPRLLAGGAIAENWRFRAEVEGGPRAGTHDWVLRTDAKARMALSHTRAREFACMKAAHAAGVPTPEPIAVCAEASPIGAPFFVMGFVSGEAQGRRIVRDPGVAVWGEELGAQLGAALARLHTIAPPHDALGFLEVPEGRPARHLVALFRRMLDRVREPRPALEYILGWLDANAPPTDRLVLCHGDFRTGNYLHEEGRLKAILDWEQAHWGDAHEDAGYIAARCWRFGGDERAPEREVGGIASRAAFLAGYASVAERPLDSARIAYWEVMGAARWAVVALLQGERHRSGGEPSLELLLTGMMAPEMELDALLQIEAIEKRAEKRIESEDEKKTDTRDEKRIEKDDVSGCLRMPENVSTEPMLERALLAMALAQFREAIQPELAPERRYLGAMIANAMAIVCRVLASDLDGEQKKVLAAIYGNDDETADMARLAREIREGAMTEARVPKLHALLRELVASELAARNPKLLASRQVQVDV